MAGLGPDDGTEDDDGGVMLPIETPHLLIRRLSLADVPVSIALWTDAGVTRYLGAPRDSLR